MYKQYLELNTLQGLICHKTQSPSTIHTNITINADRKIEKICLFIDIAVLPNKYVELKELENISEYKDTEIEIDKKNVEIED